MPERERHEISRREVLAASLAATGALTLGNRALGAPAAAGTEAAGPQRWLIIGAHADDEAKTTALLLKERKPDDKVTVMIMRVCGEGKLYDRPTWTREEAIATRTYEMQQAAAFMKAELRWWLPPHPENKNIVRTPETVAKMLGILKEIQPTRIVANWHEDFHPDHVGVGELVGEAVRQWQVPGGMPVYWFGTPGRAHAQPNFVPNHFVDISDPAEIAYVLWSRMVHRSQAEFSALKAHVQYYHDHGQKFGTQFAAGYRLERI